MNNPLKWFSKLGNKITVFVLLSMFIMVLSSFVYLRLKNNLKRSVETELKTIAELKASEISGWLSERMADARILSQTLPEKVYSLNGGQSSTPVLAVSHQLNLVKNVYNYQDIFLLDKNGVAIDGTNPKIHQMHETLPSSLLKSAGKKVCFDLYWCEKCRQTHLDFVIGLYDSLKINALIGFLVLRTDPHDYLYPIINQWPMQSLSAETEIIRIKNDSLLFLNDLRFWKGAALKVKIPIQQNQIRAINKGKAQIFEGEDYRKIKTVSYGLPIKNSEWVMICKVDSTEIYKTLRTQSWFFGISLLILLLFLGSVLFLIRNAYQKSYFKKLYDSELERKALVSRFEYLIKNANDVILLANEKGKIIEVNDAAIKTYGYEKNQFIHKDLQELGKFNFIKNSSKNHLNTAYESVHTRKDGSFFPVEINEQFIKIEDVSYYQAIIRDITERKNTEEKLKESVKNYQNLVETINDVIFKINKEGEITYVSPVIEKYTGFKTEEILGENFMAYVYEPDKALLNKKLANLDDSKFLNLEYRFVTKTGKFFWVRSSTTPVIENGIITGEMGVLTDITSQKLAELELHKNEVLYKTILAASPDAITITDLNGKILFISPKALKMFEFSSESDFISHHILEFVDETDHEKVTKGIVDLLNNNYNGAAEYKAVKSDGTRFEIDVNGDFIMDDFGKVDRMIFVIRDISDRKMAEKRLLESQEDYKKMVETINDAIYEVSLTGIIQYVSPAIEKIVGYSPEYLLGKNFFEFMYPDDVTKLKEALDHLGSKDYSYLEYRYRTKDGSLRWVRSSTNAIYIEGKLVGGRGSLTDIHERRLVEDELRKLTRVVEQSPVSIEITNLEGRIEYANPKASESSGYEMEELLGNQPGILKPENLNEDEFKRLWDTINQGNTWQGEFSDKKKNGQLFWESSTVSPVTDSDGKITNFVVVKEDITEKKAAEEKILQNNERLNAIIKAIPDILFVMDEKGNYLEYYSNDPENMLVPSDKLIGTNISQVFDQTTSALHLSKIKECIREQKLISYEYRRKEKGGTLYFETRIVPLSHNLVLRFVRDFTEKIKKDFEIYKLSSAIEQSPVLVVITDLDGNIEYVNSAFEKTTGYLRQELLGKNPRILKSGFLEPTFYENLWRTIKTGQAWQDELINKKKNGDFFWASMSITPFHNNSGTITNYLAIMQDITQRKQAEKEIKDLNATLEYRINARTAELAAANAELMQEIVKRNTIQEALIAKSTELENFFTVTLDLLSIADISGKFIKVNKAWENILGFSTVEIENHQFLDFVYSEDIPKTQEILNLLSKQNSVAQFINRFKTKNGGYRFLEWHSVPVGNAVYTAARDITERKRFEDFQFELLQLSTKVTGIPTSEINNAIKMALERISRFLVVDRAYVFEFNWLKSTMNNTIEWCNEGVSSELHNMQNMPLESYPAFMEAIANKDVINIPSVEDLPNSWRAEKEIYIDQDVKSLIAVPMYTGKLLMGFVGLDVVGEQRNYNDTEITILKVWTRMISSLISREKTEILLEQTRQNYETFFNTLDDYLWVLDPGGKVLHFNNTVSSRLGYSIQDLTNHLILKVHPAEYLNEAKKELGRLLSGAGHIFSIPLQTKSGEPIPVETKSIQGNWNGKPVIFMISKDISQIKLSELKFSKAFQSNSAMMTISNYDTGQYVDVNNAFLETMGYEREEVIGKTSSHLNLFADKGLRDKVIESLNRDKPVRKLEILMKDKNGQVKTGLLSSDSIIIGTQRCLLTVIVDISDRKKIEEALKIAQMDADKANIAKSEFLSRMSHELRTPMNAILGFAQLLDMGELNTNQKKGVNHILHSGKHLLDLINEVLDISRIESGNLSLSPEPVNINHMLQEMVEILKPLADPRKIVIQIIEASENPLFVKSDRQRLKQVLLNLINNAIKYNKDGGQIIIKLFIKKRNDKGSIPVRISIQDTGIGISAENLPKVFSPFERIGAEKSGTEGTGLGLSVVKKLIEAMDGSLGVESTLGKGSTFWIELPKTESQLDQLKKYKFLPVLDPLLSGITGKILYIEDNLSNIELIAQVLSMQNASINLITSSRGNDAVDLALEHQPDLVLLDLNLPDIHGSEVLQLLKNNQLTNAIPVVVISADAMPQQLERLLKAGAKRYLIKPLDIREFLSILNEFIVHKKTLN